MKISFIHKLLLHFTCLFVAISTSAQVIYTIAGTNNPGDYAAATKASISNPYGTAIDADGNMYIA
ncbi:MAG TPA: hypothetical protein VMR70_12580, partial [Flavisolibacter sp.]|nr:hypothetical protein [Flavisolibacter sp.]